MEPLNSRFLPDFVAGDLVKVIPSVSMVSFYPIFGLLFLVENTKCLGVL